MLQIIEKETGSPSPRGKVRTAFTLIEMMIVMGIIIVAIALAIPAIRALTGARSEQTAQNTVAAYVASAQADAIGVQDIEGVLFYLDPGVNRVTCIEVAQSPAQTTDVAGVVYLDVVAAVHQGKSRDPLVLPPGIRLQTIKDQQVNAANEPFQNSRYLGYNAYGGSLPNVLGGVILFDGNGRVYTGAYGFRFLKPTTTATPSTIQSDLAQLVFPVGTTPASSWPPAASTLVLNGQVAFALFDRETFLNQVDAGANVFLDNNNGTGTGMTVNVNPAQVGQDTWLDINTTPIFVNRYSGMLTRAE